MEYKVGQDVRMKKPHPCGTNNWKIIRVGMDFRLKCNNCTRSVLLPRAKFEKMFREVLSEPKE